MNICASKKNERNFYFLIMTNPNQLYEDMGKLNALYEELLWDHEDVLEFVADYKNDQIIIKNKTKDG